MPRRPSGHVASQRKLLIAGLFCLLPSLVVAGDSQQQQSRPDIDIDIDRPQPLAARIAKNAPGSGAHDDGDSGADKSGVIVREGVGSSPHGNSDSHRQGNSRYSSMAVDAPSTKRKRTSSYTEEQLAKHIYNNLQHPDDASALDTLALGPNTGSVRAPLPRHRALSSSGYGLATTHSARSLEDWEVEDFALLATVDGDLIAVDRATGTERWHTHLTKPVVETVHHRLNATLLSDDNFSPLDRYIWAIEPDPNGGIYMLRPGEPGLLKIELTMKQLVEQTPIIDHVLGVVYTGEKKSIMTTLDPNTGAVREWYGSTDVDDDFQQYHSDSCARPDDFLDSDKCTTSGTLSLGRTDYVVVVRKRDGPVVATLKYSEWGPNNFDKDLHKQYHTSIDDHYIVSDPKTSQLFTVSSGDYKRRLEDFSANHKVISSPIARVFDIARPRDAPASSNPELLLLPQPPLPSRGNQETDQRRDSIFIGETKQGSWFALSGSLYPLVLQSSPARCSMEGWWDLHRVKDMDQRKLRDALTGLHVGTPNPTYPAIEGPPSGQDDDNRSAHPALPPPRHQESENVTIIDKVKELPQVAATSILDFVRNPTLFVILFVLLLVFQQDLRRIYARSSLRSKLFKAINKESAEIADDQSADESVEQDKEEEKEKPAPQADEVKVTLTPSSGEADPNGIVKPQEVETESMPIERDSQVETKVDAIELTKGAPQFGNEIKVEAELAPIPEAAIETVSSPPCSEKEASPPVDTPANLDALAIEEAQPAKKKKKNHRGRRGGASHRKKGDPRSEASTSVGDVAGNGTVEDAVKNAQKLGDTARQIEPDIVTISDDVEEVSGPILKMGNLTVNEDQQLGTGSNGTIVYAGTFDGRDVAVKRMLVQFNEIATQETRLLRESDSHPNVIRYHTQVQRGPFLYIALQRCEASLADVMERGHLYPRLRQAGEKNTPRVLYQITNGIHYLHSLRIVHRDLKPHNILVNMGQNNRDVVLLVSDFGLCKKLEGGQSSFGATTAHAAGTSGWRAPELLLDDDSRDPNRSLADVSSTHSGTGSLVSSELLPNRRVGRSIDIFSLGLVFFYVLTGGMHPFDCGDRYMREVNIRKGHFNLDRLDVLGEFAVEAKGLICNMLDRNPKVRPTAQEVLSHPFFWTTKRRLDFLVDVSDQFEHECRDPPSQALLKLESYAPGVLGKDFLKVLPKEFLDSLGKQRKYTGDRLLDLLRALRNKKNHYEDMDPSLKKMVGSLPDGYLFFWTTRFPDLLLACWNVVWEVEWDSLGRFREYYEPAALA